MGYKSGENHPKAKLLDREVETIRRLHENGVSNSIISACYGVSLQTVKSIVSFRRRAVTEGIRQ